MLLRAETSKLNRTKGLEFKDEGLGLKVQGSGCRVQGSGFRVQGSGFRVQGLHLINQTCGCPPNNSRVITVYLVVDRCARLDQKVQPRGIKTVDVRLHLIGGSDIFLSEPDELSRARNPNFPVLLHLIVYRQVF